MDVEGDERPVSVTRRDFISEWGLGKSSEVGDVEAEAEKRVVDERLVWKFYEKTKLAERPIPCYLPHGEDVYAACSSQNVFWVKSGLRRSEGCDHDILSNFCFASGEHELWNYLTWRDDSGGSNDQGENGDGVGTEKSGGAEGATQTVDEESEARTYFAFLLHAVRRLLPVRRVLPHSARYTMFCVRSSVVLDGPEGYVTYWMLHDGGFVWKWTLQARAGNEFCESKLWGGRCGWIVLQVAYLDPERELPLKKQYGKRCRKVTAQSFSKLAVKLEKKASERKDQIPSP